MNIKKIILSLLIMSICPVVKAQTYNMTNTVVSTCTGSFYDDAGSAANYSNNQNLTQTFTSASSDLRLKVAFSAFNTESGYDTLSIYDGATVTISNFKNKYSGATNPPTQYSNNQSLTFHFVSDNATNNAGWTATVSCFGIASITPTTSSQSKSVVITINGSNTTFNTPAVSTAYLKHPVTNSIITCSATPSISSTTLLTANFDIPCNADLGMYDLYISQPTLGLTKISSAFNVNPYALSLSPTNASCFGLSNGTINSFIVGGTAPYTYSWSPNSQTTQNINSLAANMYTCNILDNKGCARTETAVVTQPSDINITNLSAQTICQNSSASLSPILNGGTPAYSYNWTPSATLNYPTLPNVVATPLTSTIYTLTVVDLNGCTATNTVAITVNALPTLTPGSNQTICNGSIASLSASGTAINYNWQPGNLSGATVNVSPAINTTYSVTGVNANGCTTTSTINVTVVMNPTITIAASPSSICAGSTTTLSAAGASTYTWNTASTSSSIAVSPATTAIYTVTGTIGACVNSKTISITVNALPTLTISASSPSVCSGSTVTLAGLGASTYTWTGGITNGVVFTPTITSGYTVTGTDANGCINSQNIILPVNALTGISGVVSSGTTAVSGVVTLYKYEPFLTQFDSIDSAPISVTGAYAFTNIAEDNYIIKATPTASTLQITYGSSFISWQDAVPFNHGCLNNSTQNIDVIPFVSLGSSGPGQLSGTITQTVGFGQRPLSPYSPMAPGNPIGGIVVKGGRNPGGQMFGQTITSPVTGSYTLANLPLNNPNESYFILVDIPGLDTNKTYHVIVSNANTQYNNLNFTVDSNMINPIVNYATDVKKINSHVNEFKVYPNPTKNNFNIRYELIENSLVKIELIDVLGKTLKIILPSTQLLPQKYNQTIDVKDLNSGIYFIKTTINTSENTVKLLIID